MKKYLILAAAALLLTGSGIAQMEGPATTQALVRVETKGEQVPALADVQIKVNGKEESLTGWSQVPPNGTQIALLIDDGLRESVGRELKTLGEFVSNLPPGTAIYIGYMRNGTVITEQSFTTDHAAAATKLRLPLGSPGISASPYFCLSEFVKHWPTDQRGARFAMMITNGVDPYNGSTSPLNQDSPYVQATIDDAQRAGVAVSSIYFADAGFRGNRGNFSGQSYLAQVAEATGGESLWQGLGNPVSMAPFLAQFQHSISETFVASFTANVSGNKLADLRVDTKMKGVKLRAAKAVRAGNAELATAMHQDR